MSSRLTCIAEDGSGARVRRSGHKTVAGRRISGAKVAVDRPRAVAAYGLLGAPRHGQMASSP